MTGRSKITRGKKKEEGIEGNGRKRRGVTIAVRHNVGGASLASVRIIERQTSRVIRTTRRERRTVVIDNGNEKRRIRWSWRWRRDRSKGGGGGGGCGHEEDDEEDDEEKDERGVGRR